MPGRVYLVPTSAIVGPYSINVKGRVVSYYASADAFGLAHIVGRVKKARLWHDEANESGSL